MKYDAITTGPLTSVAELIDFAEPMMIDNINNPPLHNWAFRGQSRDYGNLIPSFQREIKRESFGTAELIERRLINAFRKHYNALKDRDKNMPNPAQIRVDYDLRCLSVMQHYEIPTRLLDWTSNFWTAVYFACASEPASNAELWYYNRGIFDPQRNADPSFQSLLDAGANPLPEPSLLNHRDEQLIFELDPKITPRMVEQSAHHTVSASVFSDHASLLFQFLPQPYTPTPNMLPYFGRIIIDGSCKGKALQFLDEEKNITASTIFPDVVGLGRFLRWQFDSLRTMLL